MSEIDHRADNGGADHGDGADRRLDAWLAGAPRLAASVAFEQRVMRALDDARPPRSWRARISEFLFAAHTLRWNVASAALAGALVFALGLGWLLRGGSPRMTNDANDVAAVSVRFVLPRTEAAEVRLAGDFTAWQARVPLVRQPDGSWVAEVKLVPGDYEYAFVVDGKQWAGDPAATRFRDDGFGGRNALLTVPGKARRVGYES